jgi:hypothetical protein
MAKDKTIDDRVVLWTPWGTEKTPKPGERFATLRRLALRLKRIGKPLPRMRKPSLH